MDKKVKKSSKPKFELEFTSRARAQLEQPEAKFEELLNKFEKLGIKFKELRIKFEGLGVEFKKWWTKFTKKIKSSSSQESKTQDYNLDNDNVSNYLVDYFNDTYEIYHYRNHHYEPIIYNDDKTKSYENLSEDIYADTTCRSFESETGYPLAATSNVNEGASCSKIGDKNNISSRWTSQGAAALHVNNSAEVSPMPLRRPPRPPMPSRQSIKAYRENRNVNYNSNNNDIDHLLMNGDNSEKMSHNPLQSQNKFIFPISSINSSDHYYDTVYDSNASSPASPRLISQGSASSQVGNSEEVSSIPLKSISLPKPGDAAFWISETNSPTIPLNPTFRSMPSRQSIKAYRENRNVNYNSNNNDIDHLLMNGDNSEKMSHNPLQSQNKFIFPISSINSSDHYYDTVYDSNASSPASPRLISQGSASSQVGNSEEVSSIPLKSISLPKPGDAAFWISETNSPTIPLNPTFRSMPSKQSINNYHKNENEFSLDVNEGASCSKIGNAEKKVPPAIAPKPKNWNPESASNINNLQVNDLDLRKIRQSLRKTNHR